LLAKIFGLYTIEYRHISTEKKGDEYVINGGKSGKTVRMNFLVMENLFHGRRFSKVSLSTVSGAVFHTPFSDLRPQRFHT
jgi:hypothetical protein